MLEATLAAWSDVWMQAGKGHSRSICRTEGILCAGLCELVLFLDAMHLAAPSRERFPPVLPLRSHTESAHLGLTRVVQIHSRRPISTSRGHRRRLQSRRRSSDRLPHAERRSCMSRPGLFAPLPRNTHEGRLVGIHCGSLRL